MCTTFSHNFKNITQKGQNHSCDTIALKRRFVRTSVAKKKKKRFFFYPRFLKKKNMFKKKKHYCVFFKKMLKKKRFIYKNKLNHNVEVYEQVYYLSY